MSGRPWYKRCGADFIEGTMGLSLEEKGAYSLCLDLIYSYGGPIADDPRWIAGVCNVSIRKWKALRAALISAGKITVVGDKISNSRAENELIISGKTPRNFRETSVKHPRKVAENDPASNENNDLGASIRVDKIREEEKIPLRGAEAPTEADVFRLGKSVLGKSSGGVIVKLKAHCGGVLPDMQAILTDASAKAEPMEWVQRVLRGPSRDDREIWRGVDCAPLTAAQREYAMANGLS